LAYSLSCPFVCGWGGRLSQQYRATAVRQSFPSESVRGGPLLAYTARLVLSSWLPGQLSAPESAFLLSEVLMIRRLLGQCSPWHRPGIRRCIDPATVSPLPLCSGSREG